MRFAPIFLLLSLSCAHFQSGESSPEDDLFLNYRHARACKNPTERRGAYTSPSSTLSVNVPVATTIRQLMCTEHTHGDFSRQLYVRTAPESIDPLTAALMITSCVSSGRCDGTGTLRSTHSSGPRLSMSYSRVGEFRSLAEGLDPQAVSAAVDPLEVHPVLKDSFLRRVEASRQHILALAADYSPRMRRVFVELPTRVRAARIADQDALAPLYGRFDVLKIRADAALLDNLPTDALVREAVVLREEYVTACQSRGRGLRYCIGGPIGRPLTELLVRLYVQQGRWIDALTEHAVLRYSPDVSDVRYEIHVTVSQQMRKEDDDYRRYREAQQQGVSQQTLNDHFGTEPISFADWTNGAGIQPPREDNLGTLIRTGSGRVQRVRGEVSGIRVRGDVTTLRFSERRRGVRRESPILLAKDDGRALDAGRTVTAFIDPDTRVGRIVSVTHSSQGVAGTSTVPHPHTQDLARLGSFVATETEPSAGRN